MTSALSDLPLFVIAARDSALKRVEANAGAAFKCAALKFVVNALRTHGKMSGEELTNECWAAGIQAHDRRAMGSVFMTLIRDGLIEKCGECKRLRGHGCSGGSVYRIKTSL